jgi:hypothetical protein
MKVNQQKIETFKEYSRILYFIDKYLLHEYQLIEGDPGYHGYLVIFKTSSNNEPYHLAEQIVDSMIAKEVMGKFGYLIMKQDDQDIIIKNIF